MSSNREYVFTLPARRPLKQYNILKATQQLLGICIGITADGKINEKEFAFLRNWFSENHEVAREWPGSVIAQRVEAIMADGVVSQEERDDLLTTLQSITGSYFADTGTAAIDEPYMPLDEGTEIIIPARRFCFTGNFIFGPRSACIRAIEAAGGKSLDNITYDLDYLVIGSYVSKEWANTSYGRKIEKAVKYRDDGAKLRIVSEAQWSQALGDSVAQKAQHPRLTAVFRRPSPAR